MDYMKQNKTKILMIIPSFYPLVGGAERQLIGLLDKLAKTNFEVIVLTRKLSNTEDEEILNSARIIRMSNFKYPLGFLLKLSIWLIKNKLKYDIIHVHTLNSPAFLSSIIGKIVNKPVIIKVTRSSHNTPLSKYNNSFIGKFLFIVIKKLTTKFIAITTDVKNELVQSGVDIDNIISIPNGVEISKNKQTKINKKNKEFIYLGRLIERKRIDILIMAWNNANMDSRASLKIIGTGKEKVKLEKICLDLGLQNSITFTGEKKHSDIKKFLKYSDVIILPSSSEGMSNALLEGMSYGLIPIVSNIKANKDLVKDGQNGYLFNTTSELSELLNKIMLNSDEMNNEIRFKTIEIIKNNFSFNYVMGCYIKLYGTLLKEYEIHNEK